MSPRLVRAALLGLVMATPLSQRVWAQTGGGDAPPAEAAPAPDPATDPATEPAPDPATEPAPAPAPGADPATAPDPGADPATEPAPAPDTAEPPAREQPAPMSAAPGTLDDPEIPRCERAVNWNRPAKGAKAAGTTTSAEDLAAEADRRAFAEAADRFARSARDYQVESYAVIEAAIAKQKDFVRRSYGKKTRELDVTERQRREDAIARFERFIERYPNNADYTPDAMFRLAELYFERSGTRFADAETQYYQDRKLYERGKLPAEPVAPEREFKDTVRMYRTLLSRFGSSYRYADAVYYLLGYVLAEQGDDTPSREAWRTLAERFPKSEYAAEAWLRIGEMHFDYGEFQEAATAYLHAMEYTDNRFYDKALYKLGWTYFQLYDYDKAIRRFKDLIAWYDAHASSGGTASALREEAIDYLAGSLAEDDWDNDGLPDENAGVARALSYVSGKEPYERDIIKKYAETLKSLADRVKWAQAIEVYRRLLALDPLAVEAPSLQMEIIQIYDDLREIDKAAEERRRLADLFGPKSAWWQANQNNPKAQVRVSRAMEDAMRNRALWHHQRAQELKVQAGLESNPALLVEAREQYRKASVAYEEYLAKYPNEPASYEMTFFLAETYWYSDEYARAAPIYRKIALDEDNTKYRDAAAISTVKAYERMLAEAAAAGRVPAKAVPGSSWTPPAEPEGASSEYKPANPEPIPEAVRDWITAVDFYVDQDFKQDGSRQLQAEVSYQAAEILYRFKNYQDARDRFAQVISCYPREEVAAYAAANIINSYRDENDWSNLEKWANVADRLNLGNAEQQADIRKEIKVFKLGSLFKRAEALYEAGKYLEAAREFKRLADQNPTAAFADKAYFNAANAFKKERYYDSAAEIFEKLVTDPQYAKSEFAEESLFELGETNKLFFNFDRAINAFLTLYDRYPESENRRYALYQAAILQEQSGDAKTAARTFEKYADLYRDREESPGTLYRAAELWRKVGDEAEEQRVLERFVDRHRSTPGLDRLVLESMGRLADMAYARRKVSLATRMWQDIVREYVARGQQPGTPAAEAAAKAAFQLVEQTFNDYKSLKLNTPNQKRAGAIIKRKNDMMAELERQYTQVLDYGSLDWTIAVADRLADLYKEFADTLYAAPEPEGLSEEEYEVYVTQIEDLGLKYENVAIQRYEKAIEQSRRLKVTNEWSRKALEAINKYKPAEYPLFKEEKIQTDFEPLYSLDTRVPEVR
ncbi:MAG: tetratricopeptide repeat protein [Deltaproteobacteria bacterium]|nr:tetratricopeptide repeat protein [Deltaproteobacteria bacterium]MCB9785559.1 tetratricopeptide repeat protein [Deltaproteobacteria bacterium]